MLFTHAKINQKYGIINLTYHNLGFLKNLSLLRFYQYVLSAQEFSNLLHLRQIKFYKINTLQKAEN